MTENTTTNTNTISNDAASLPQMEVRQFKFDAETYIADIDVSPNPERQQILSAKMSKPSKDALVRREAMTSTEYIEAGEGAEQLVITGTGANARLFDEIAREIKGVRFPGEPEEVANEWREITPEISAALYSSWKSAFINGIYKISAQLRESESFGVVLGGQEPLVVDLTVGDEEDPIAVITFELPEPMESERESYMENSLKIIQTRGAKKARTKLVTDLNRSIKFFDSLLSRPEGRIYIDQAGYEATAFGMTFDKAKENPLHLQRFLDAIDPIYKRTVLGAAMSRYQAKVQD